MICLCLSKKKGVLATPYIASIIEIEQKPETECPRDQEKFQTKLRCYNAKALPMNHKIFN